MPPTPTTHTTDALTIAALEMLRQVEHVDRGGRPRCPHCGAERPSHTDNCLLGALLDHGQHARFMTTSTGATAIEVLEVLSRERAKKQA